MRRPLLGSGFPQHRSGFCHIYIQSPINLTGVPGGKLVDLRPFALTVYPLGKTPSWSSPTANLPTCFPLSRSAPPLCPRAVTTIVTAVGLAAAIGGNELQFEDLGEESRTFYASMATPHAFDAPGKVSSQLFQLTQLLRVGQTSTELTRPLADFPDAGRFEATHVYVVPHRLETIEVVDETGAQLAKAKWLLSPIPAWYLALDRF